MTLDTGDTNWQNFLFPTFFSRMTGYCKTSLNQRFYICNLSLVLTKAPLQFPYLPLSLLCTACGISNDNRSDRKHLLMRTLCLALFEEHDASFIFATALSGRCYHYFHSHTRKPGRREEQHTARASQLRGGGVWIQAVLFQSAWCSRKISKRSVKNNNKLSVTEALIMWCCSKSDVLTRLISIKTYSCILFSSFTDI